jgi:hypothetical protein
VVAVLWEQALFLQCSNEVPEALELALEFAEELLEEDLELLLGA